MPISAAAKARGLRAIFDRPLWLGLASRVEGSSLVEIADRDYARQRAKFTDPAIDGDEAMVSNAERIIFPPFATDLPRPPALWFVSDHREQGAIIAHGPLERRYIDPETGIMYSHAERQKRAGSSPDGARWALGLVSVAAQGSAGMEVLFPPGAIRIWLDDGEAE